MTEIQAGNSFTASTRLLQEMHKAAEDGVVEAKELARLAQIALDDSSGLTEDEQKMLSSLYSGKIDTSGLSEEEKNAITQLQNGSKGVSAEIVDKNIKSLQSLSAHESDPNQLNFSNLQLISESKSFLSRASFGLFGGTTQTSHVVRISDGNIPAVHNPSETTTMAERQDIDRQNLVNMLGPLEQELAEGMAENSDLRQRFAEFLGEPADSQTVTKKIQELADKIKEFKTDPNKKGWTTSDDLTALMNSYANKPAEGNPRMTSGYMNAMLGAFWNATESRNMANAEQQNFQSGEIEIPATLEEINTKLSQTNNMSKQQLEVTLFKTSAFIEQLDALKQSDPEAYQQVLRGTDESGIDVLRAQVSEIRQHLTNGNPIGQAQLNQVNTMRASLQQMQKSLNLSPSSDLSLEPGQVDANIIAFNEMLADPNLSSEAKAEISQQLKAFQNSSQPALSPESQAAIDALRMAYSEASNSMSSSYLEVKESAATRSGMIAELKHAESTLSQLLTQNGISEAGREKLQSQLDATRLALSQLQAGQEVNLTEPGQAAAFQQVLKGLQDLKPPAPAVTNPLPGLDPTTEALIGDADNLANDLELVVLPGPYNPVSNSSLFNPEPLSLNYSASNFSLLDFGNSFGSPFSSYGTSSNLLYGNSFSNDSLGICSPSLGYSGYSSGLGVGGFNLWEPSYSFPSLYLPSVGDSASSVEAPPSLFDNLLSNIGETVELSDQQHKSLEALSAIQNERPNQSNPNLVALENLIRNPQTSEAAQEILNIYQETRAKNNGRNWKESNDLLEFAISSLQQSQLSSSAQSLSSADVVGLVRELSTKKNIAEEVQNIRTAGLEQRLKGVAASSADLKGLAETILGPEAASLNPEDIPFAIAKHSNSEEAAESIKIVKNEVGEKLKNKNIEILKEKGHNTEAARYDALLSLERRLSSAEAQELQQIQELIDTAINDLGPTSSLVQSQHALATRYSTLAGMQQYQHTISWRLNDYNATLSYIKTQLESPDLDPDLRRRLEGEQGLFTEGLKNYQETGRLNGGTISLLETARQIRNTDAFLTAFASQNTNPPQLSIMQGFQEKFQEITGDTSLRPHQIRKKLVDLRREIQAAMNTGSLNAPSQADQRRLGLIFSRPQSSTEEVEPLTSEEINSDVADWTVSSVEDSEKIVQNALVKEVQNADLGRTLSRTAGDPEGIAIKGFIEENPELVDSPEFREQLSLEILGEIDRVLQEEPEEDIMATMMSEFEAVESLSLEDAAAAGVPGASALGNIAEGFSREWEQLSSLDGNALRDALANKSERDFTIAQMITDMDNRHYERSQDSEDVHNQLLSALGQDPRSVHASTSSPQPQYDSKTQALINEANALGDSLILAPVPSQGGEDFLNNLINDFIDIIRDLDYKTRQLVLQQLAQQMTNNAITQFYKDKVDEGNDYHQQALDRLAENFKEQIERTIESGLASQAESSQGVAAVSGQVTGAALANAIESVSARESIAQMLDVTTQMNPPLSQQQQERILDAVTRIMEAGGVPSLTDAQLGLPGLSNPLLRDQVVS